MRDRPKVGEILVQAGIIDELQLAAALGEQTRWGRRLGMTLIKLGMVQEGHLVRALAKQFDLPVASLAGKKIAPEVIALVPAKVACEHSVIPLFVKKEGHREQLFLGMEEPSDLGILDDLAFRTGMVIRPVMVGPTEIGEAIDRYYNAKPAPAPTPSLPDPMRGADTLSETNLRNIQEEAGPSLSQLLKPGAGPTTLAEMPPMQNAVSSPSPNIVRPGASRGIDVTPVVFDLPPASAERSSALAAAPVAPSVAAPAAALAPMPAVPSPAHIASPAPAHAPAPPPLPKPTLMPTPAPSVAASPVAAAPNLAPVAPAAQTAPLAPHAPVDAVARAAAAQTAAEREAQAAEFARVLDETERTRLVAKAIAHLLIEKGLLTLDELQARIEKMKTGRG